MSLFDRLHIALFTLLVLLVSLLIFPLPGNDVSYIADPTLHLQVRQLIYWSCAFISFVWLIKTTTGNLAGTIVCTLFGPVTLLTMLLMWISYKIFPRKKKVESNGS